MQLAQSVPAVRQHIINAADERSDIASQGLRDQWRQLVCSPLLKLSKPEPKTYIVVVDALDECDDKYHIPIIVQMLAELQSLLARVRLRVFLTSRPEVPIQYGFSQMPEGEHQDFALHRVSPLIINKDIRLFLEHEFRSIKKKRLLLRTDWPGAEAIAQLVKSSSRLFIWAATACRFIEEGTTRSLMRDRLQAVLQSSGPVSGPEAHLDKIYTTVLTYSVPSTLMDREKEKFCLQARYILGSIVVLLSPLSALSLGRMLPLGDLVSKDDVEDVLQGLHAILDVPEDTAEPLHLHHPSFRDFLLSKDRCTDENFWVEEKGTHEKMASCCLKLMSAPSGLRQDLCGLFKPGTLRSEVAEETVASSLPPELQYACRYWVEHLQRSQQSIVDGGAVHVFLQTHLLHWLEAMSLIGETDECVRLLARLQALIAVRVST